MSAAIILAGGIGSRVRDLTKDRIPKILIPINKTPFIDYLYDFLCDGGINQAYISGGFCFNELYNYFLTLNRGDSNNYCGNDLFRNTTLIEETERLGTGGALRHVIDAVERIGSPIMNYKYCMVVNGDCLFIQQYNLVYDLFSAWLLDWYETNNPYRIDGFIFSDYTYNDGSMGTLDLNENDEIIQFKEKTIATSFVNLGFYWIKPELLRSIPTGTSSLEKDIFPQWIKEGKIFKIMRYPIDHWIQVGDPKGILDAELKL